MIERLRDELATFIRRVTGRLDYQAFHPGTVRAQDGSGRLDIELDRPTTMPPLTGVPIRHGLPGVTVRVAAGARVLVTWERGDPARPVAALWEPGSVTDIVVNGGSRKAARDGDPTGSGTISVAASSVPPGTSSALTITYTPPGGAPQVVVIAGLPPGVTGSGTLTLTGTITDGTSVLKLP